MGSWVGGWGLAAIGAVVVAEGIDGEDDRA